MTDLASDKRTVDSIRDRLSHRLDDHLCGMCEGYDDSVTGFNEAWDVMRKLFNDVEKECAACEAGRQPSAREREREMELGENGTEAAKRLEEAAAIALNQGATYAETLKLNAVALRLHCDNIAAMVRGREDACRVLNDAVTKASLVLTQALGYAQRDYLDAVMTAEKAYDDQVEELRKLFDIKTLPAPVGIDLAA